MSAVNGDKARFHRKRKARIARRARNRQRLSAMETPAKRSLGSGSEKKEAAE